jgi:hypothetical protein
VNLVVLDAELAVQRVMAHGEWLSDPEAPAPGDRGATWVAAR